jgi:SAM-dependent methyltransferase
VSQGHIEGGCVVKIVSREVWNTAQQSEHGFWDTKRYDPSRLIYSIYDKYGLMLQIERICPQILKERTGVRRVLEIGIGPLGFGMVSLLEPSHKWEITGIDPLPRMELPELPSYLKSFLSELYMRTKNYVQTPAEDFNEPKNSFDLIICDNVLEHTFDPNKIINNTFNLLAPGGYLVLRENTLSHLSKVRKKICMRKYLDVAHPISFTYQELIDIINQNSYKTIYQQRDQSELFKRIWGKSRRMLFFCQKPK